MKHFSLITFVSVISFLVTAPGLAEERVKSYWRSGMCWGGPPCDYVRVIERSGDIVTYELKKPNIPSITVKRMDCRRLKMGYGVKADPGLFRVDAGAYYRQEIEAVC